MNRVLVWIALSCLSLAACAQETAPPVTSQPVAQEQPAQPAPAQEPSEVDSEQAATASQETTSDATGEERSDSSLARLAQLPADPLANSRWRKGTHYEELKPAQPTSVGPNKVEVAEVFWFGCTHCYALEPYLANWEKKKPDGVELVKVPVMWGPVHRAHARLYYTLQALNREDLVSKVFDTIHQRGNMLVANDENRTKAMQRDFAVANGIRAEDFDKAYNSFSVNTNLQRAEQLTQRYRVEGVPLVVVNGKYVTDVGRAGGQNELLQLINDLAAAEKKR
jgi:thiol:disulfide interchange protein DsbA